MNLYNQIRIPKLPWEPAVAFLAAAALIAALGAVFYAQQRGQFAREAQTDLAAIAELKAEDISRWLKERITDGVVLSKSPLLARNVGRWFDNPEHPDAGMHTRTRLEAMLAYDIYQSVILTDLKGNVRLVLGRDQKRVLGQATRQKLLSVAGTGLVQFSDFYLCDQDGQVHLDVFAPLLDGKRATAVVILRIDPDKYLFPLIQSWPVPCKSSETQIVRREGDSVLFLNDLRFRPDAAMKLKIPLADTTEPAVMAALGRSGMVEGYDYRGEPVLAVVRAIPGTPWFMVAKVDQDEIFRPLRLTTFLIAGSCLLLILLAGAALGYAWQRRQKHLYQQLYRIEQERMALSEHYRYLSQFANDMVLLIRADGTIVEANDRALQAYGYTSEEMIGRPVADLRVLDEQEKLYDHLHQARESGGLIYETIHRRRDGTQFPVEVSVRPMDIDGTLYYQKIIRDITERKRHQMEISRINRELAAIKRCNQAIFRATDEHKLLETICRIVVEEAGYRFAWVGYAEHDPEKTVKPVAFFGHNTGYINSIKVTWGGDDKSQSPTGTAIRTGKACVNRDSNGKSDYGSWGRQALAHGFRSSIALPLAYGGTTYGVLNIYAAETDAFSQAEIGLLEELAEDISYGIAFLRNAKSRAAAYKELEQKNAELAAANEELAASEEELKAAEEELRHQNEELIKSQAALEASENRYRRLFEAAKDGILILNAETGVIEDANPFIEELLGYSREELVGKELWKLGMFQDIAASRERFVKLQQEKYIRYEDLPMQTKNGDIRDVEFVSNVYVVGDRRVIQCNIRDITERKAAQKALAMAEERFRLAEKAGGIGSWEWDMIANRLFWSEEMYRIFGQDPNTFTPSNQAVFAAIVPEDLPRVQAAVEASVKQRIPFDLEYRIRTGDGEVRWVHSQGKVINDQQGRPVKALGVVQDVTERKNAEEELKRNYQELKRWQMVMLDREDRVLELKQEVNELLKALGQPPKYME